MIKKIVLALLFLPLFLPVGLRATITGTTYQVVSSQFMSGGNLLTSESFELASLISPRANSTLMDSGLTLSLFSGFMGGIGSLALNPFIVSITPNSGNNISTITIQSITGINFATDASLYLSKSGEDDIEADNVTVISSEEMTCQFNLAGVTAGTWNVKVINTDTRSGVLVNGFTINDYSLPAGVVINSPNPFDPGSESTVFSYNLNEDKSVAIYIFTTTAELIWKRVYPAGSQGGRSGINRIEWNGETDFGDLVSNGVYLLHVVEHNGWRTIARGKIAVLR